MREKLILKCVFSLAKGDGEIHIAFLAIRELDFRSRVQYVIHRSKISLFCYWIQQVSAWDDF
jgi:hypothetical protein